jgi:hypothetical protein
VKGSAEDPRTRELGRKISGHVGCARAGAEEIRPVLPTEDAVRRRFAAASAGLDRLSGPRRSSKGQAPQGQGRQARQGCQAHRCLAFPAGLLMMPFTSESQVLQLIPPMRADAWERRGREKGNEPSSRSSDRRPALAPHPDAPAAGSDRPLILKSVVAVERPRPEPTHPSGGRQTKRCKDAGRRQGQRPGVDRGRRSAPRREPSAGVSARRADARAVTSPGF